MKPYNLMPWDKNIRIIIFIIKILLLFTTNHTQIYCKVMFDYLADNSME